MTSVFSRRPSAEEFRRYSDGRWGKVRVWWPVVFMTIVIAIESTNTFSSEHTSGWMRPVVERIFGHINDKVWLILHHLARKSGHFTGYGMLALTWLRGWLLTYGTQDNLTLLGWRWRSTWMAVAGTAFVASLDEWHQTFIPSRTGLFSDVVLDTVGGSVLCGLVWLICRWWRQA